MIKNLIRAILCQILGPAYPHLKNRILFLSGKVRKKYFSLNGLDKKIERYLDYDGGYYVELGANDGVRQSNTLYFEINRKWSGVLIEPVPQNFLKCREQRGGQNTFFCNACVSFDYKDKYVDMKYADLMTISSSLDLDSISDREHLDNAKNYLSQNEVIVEFGAVARTLTDLLDEAKAPTEIDLLSLDVEGAEFEVLRGLDFEKYKFKYLMIELRNLPRMEKFLSDHGYVLKEKLSNQDYLFCNKFSLSTSAS